MIEGTQIVGGLAQLIGSLLSWLHQGTPNICPGSWPWTVSLAGALLAASPLLGAVLVALLRKGTGNNYGVGMLATLGGIGLLFGFVVPWSFVELVFTAIKDGQVGSGGVVASGLANNICVFSQFGTQWQYLTGGQIGYQALTGSGGNTVELVIYLVMLGAVPLFCLFAVMLQQRVALRRGPRWPGRLMWLPFLACILFTLLFPANLMAHLWLGFLPASLLGIVVVALFGKPSWSVINRPQRAALPPPEPYRQAPEPPPPAPMPEYQGPPPALRPLPPTRIGPVPGVPLALPAPAPAAPPGQLADTPRSAAVPHR